MDEPFTPGHFEDDNYCYWARLAGFQLKIGGDTFAYHTAAPALARKARNRGRCRSADIIHAHQGHPHGDMV
ncbi:hypothetical protein [Paenibacillus apiarius]|uniref:hypothetical protein n=1 Tax=Paenibacillus apiarius TaxID=46240 RepID=UPI0019824294|nr:hypothetical protein [Paenibacillus apiarius]MBN3527103.1 hypothetical protein [Paenibacillus apiarius]